MYDFSFIPDCSLPDVAELEGEAPRRMASHELRLEAFHRALYDHLTERQRTILMMYYVDHKNTVEIAALLSVNKSTVSRTINRSVEKLRDAMRLYLGDQKT